MMRLGLLFCLGILAMAGCRGNLSERPENEASGGNGGAGSNGGSGASGGSGGDGDDGTCQSHRAFFNDVLWPVLDVRCYGCHQEGGNAGPQRLRLSRDDLELSFLSTVEVARIAAGTSSLLVTKASHELSNHGGAERVVPGSVEYADLAAFALAEQKLAASKECTNLTSVGVCTESKVGPRLLRLLTAREFENTVRDALGAAVVAWAGPSFNAPPTSPSGYNNNAAFLSLDLDRTKEFQSAAVEISTVATEATALPGLIQGASCTAEDRTCVDLLVQTYGARLFRRAPVDAEKQRYLKLYDDVLAKTGATFKDGAEWVLAALLQSPNTLYRSELGESDAQGGYTLTQHEIASQLSYTFSASPPSAELVAKAERGELSSPDVLEAEAMALLQTPRGHEVLADFMSQWSGYTVQDSNKTAPNWAALSPQMVAETRAFFDAVAYAPNALEALLAGRYDFASAELKTFYADSPDAGRSGLLTQGSMLAKFGGNSLGDGESSPTKRGNFTYRRLLCQVIGTPPPVDEKLPPPDPNATSRERYLFHSQNEPCATCHTKLDPMGFGFEHFDGWGRYRATDLGGRAIDASGHLPSGGASFNGPEELATLLAASSDVAECLGDHLITFGFALEKTGDFACRALEVQRRLKEGASFAQALAALAREPHFTRRAP